MISASRLERKKEAKPRSSWSLDRGNKDRQKKDNLPADRNHGRLLGALKNAQVANELSNHSIHWSVACSWEYDIARERGRTLSLDGGSHFSVHSNAGCGAWLTDTLSLRDRQTSVSKRAALGSRGNRERKSAEMRANIQLAKKSARWRKLEPSSLPISIPSFFSPPKKENWQRQSLFNR